MQTLIVAMLVLGCTLYAAWTLMPAAARRTIATTLLRRRLPDALAQRLRRAATGAAGCGCDGCDHAPAKSAASSATPAVAQPQIIAFHRRMGR